jgi:hypothetical protein
VNSRPDTRDERQFADGSYLREHPDRLAWIMGSSRSGSTWLLKMLRELDEVVGVDDPHLGHHLGVWRPLPLAWAIGAEPSELKTLDAVKREEDDYFFSDAHRDAWMPGLRELVRTRFCATLPPAAERTRDPVIVVKEPGGQAASMIFDLFPESRLVFLLRDGRDVVDSWLDGYRRGSWAIEEGAFAVAPAGRAALASWLGTVWSYRCRVVSEVFERLPEERRILVRYERLLDDTPEELERIAGALGLDASPAQLRRVADRHAYERVAPAERGPLQPVRAAEPGHWRKRSSAERKAMHAAMAGELERWGYLPPRSARRVA